MTHVSPLSVQLEVMLALKLIGFPEKIDLITGQDLLVIADDTVTYLGIGYLILE